MNQKTDKRHCLAKHAPEVSSCRGGIRLILTGKNTQGKTVQTTAFIDNAFIPGLVENIFQVCKHKQRQAADLVEQLKKATHGD